MECPSGQGKTDIGLGAQVGWHFPVPMDEDTALVGISSLRTAGINAGRHRVPGRAEWATCR